MKTAQEFLNELADSAELKKELLATGAEDYEAFLRKHGCEASPDEVKRLAAGINFQMELTDSELDAVVGGEEGINHKFDRTRCYCRNSGCPDFGCHIHVDGNHEGEIMTCPSCGQHTLEGVLYLATQYQ